MRSRILGAVLAVLLFASAVASADLILMKDGRRITGRIVEENAEEVKIQVLVTGPPTTLKKKDIDRIERLSGATDDVAGRLEALDPARPAGYLETGKWCLAQKDPRAREIGAKLLAIAARLDRALYVDANLALGEYLLQDVKDRARAAVCYRRVVRVSPADPTARARFRELRDALTGLRREATDALAVGLGFLGTAQYEKALEPLKKAGDSPFAERLPALVGGSLADLLQFAVAKKVCPECNGALKSACSSCNGQGATLCKACNGSGQAPLPPGKAPGPAGSGVCRTCFGFRSILCRQCESVRVITVQDPSYPTKTLELIVRPGKEVSMLAPGTILGKALAEGALPEGVVKGGTVPCKACKGVGPKLPQATINLDNLPSLIAFLQRQARGESTAEEQLATRMPRVGSYEADADADDRIVYIRGSWCVPASKGAGGSGGGESSGAGGGAGAGAGSGTGPASDADLQVLEKGARAFQPARDDAETLGQDPKALAAALLGDGGAPPESATEAGVSGRLRRTTFTYLPVGQTVAPTSFLYDEGGRTLTLVLVEAGGPRVTSRSVLVDPEGQAVRVPEGVDATPLREGRCSVVLYYVGAGSDTHLRREGEVDRLTDAYRARVYRVELRDAVSAKLLAAWP